MNTRAVAVGATAVLAGSVISAWAPSRPATAQIERPNILVVMTDDQTLDSVRYMPKLEAAVAEKGTVFENSFVGYALCCPSRATYLTGQFAHNHGVLGNGPPDGGYARLDHANTLPVWMRAAGYRTGHVGKYLNGYGSEVPQTTVPPGYDEWQGLVDGSTYRMYEYTINDDGVLRTYGTAPADYQTDVLSARAEQLVRAWAPSSQPFFLTVAPLAPHGEGKSSTYQGGPPRPAPRHQGLMAEEPLPRPPSFNEADVSDKPKYVQDQPVMSEQLIGAATRNYRERAESLLAVDDMVQRLVTALTETGELEKTVVVFTSDNGFLHGEHRFVTGKFHVFEPVIRVPLIVRGPGFPAGRVGAPVVNVDLAPTFLQIAGAKAGRALDGVSLLTTMLGGEAGQRVIFNENGPSTILPSGWQRAIRGPGYVYSERSTGEREYYDLAADPHQLDNRASDPALAGRIAELSARLAALTRCSGASCNGLPSSPPPPPVGVNPAPTPAPGAGGGQPRGEISLPRRRLGRKGTTRVTVAVTCAQGTEAGCFGTLRLTIMARSRRGRTVRMPAGRARLALDAGETRRVRVRLSSSARRHLRRHRRVKMRATAEILGNAGAAQTVRRTYSFARR